MWRRLGGNSRQRWLPAALPILVAKQHDFTYLPVLYTLRSFTQRNVLLFFSSSVSYVEN